MFIFCETIEYIIKKQKKSIVTCFFSHLFTEPLRALEENLMTGFARGITAVEVFIPSFCASLSVVLSRNLEMADV